MHHLLAKNHPLSALVWCGLLVASIAGTPVIAHAEQDASTTYADQQGETTDTQLSQDTDEQAEDAAAASTDEAATEDGAATTQPEETAAPAEGDADSNVTAGDQDEQAQATGSDADETSETDPASETEPAEDPAEASDADAAACLAETSDAEPSVTDEVETLGAAAETSTQGASQTSDLIDGHTFVIEHGKGGYQVVDAVGGKTANRTNVQTYSYNKSEAQKWCFVLQATINGISYYSIASNAAKEQVLDVYGGRAASGANVQLYNYNGTDAQLWQVVFVDQKLGKVKLVSKLSAKAGYDLVLDIAGGKYANSTNMQIYRSNNSDAQSFYLLNVNPEVAATSSAVRSKITNGVYTVSASGNAKRVADIYGGSTANKANVQLYTSNGTNAQRLILTSDSDGYYTISVLGSGKVFDVSGASIIPGANVQQYTSNGTAAQKWAIRQNSNGTYTFVNKGTGLVLDIADSLKNGTNIRAYIDTYAWSGTFVRSYQSFGITADKTPLLDNGYYTIKSLKDQNQVLDIYGASANDGDYVQLYRSNDTLAQKFEVESLGNGIYRIRTAASGGWLTAKSGSDYQQSKRVAQIGTSATEANDLNTWKIFWDSSGYWALQNVSTGYVLDLNGGKVANRTAVQTYRSNGTDAQHFLFCPTDLIAPGVYFIQSRHNSYTLNVADGSTKTGAAVNITTSYTGDDRQKFVIEKCFDAYTIYNVKSGHYISAASAGVKHKTNVVQDYNAQLWTPRIVDRGGGRLYLVNVNSGLLLEAPNSNNANAVIFDRSQSSSTTDYSCQWLLKPTSAASVTIKTSSAPTKAAKTDVRVLFIGNSFTFYNDLAYMVGYITGATVATSTKPSSYLYQHANASTDIGAQTLEMLSQSWDYVIIQEQSGNAINNYDSYLTALKKLGNLAVAKGATPIIYATWAYQKLGDLDYVHDSLQCAFSDAKAATGYEMTNVGQAFADKGFDSSLYVGDNKHPSITASQLAATVISNTLKKLLSS